MGDSDLSGDTATKVRVCYLCGESLEDTINSDHIPPKLFFAPSIRQRYNLDKLLTAKVHQQCNQSYRMDEEYLVYTLMAYIRGSEAGLALYNYILAKYKRGDNVALVQQVLAEFERYPSGLYLPGGQLLQRRDGGRIRRVAWKIVRGLHFHRTGEVLRQDLVVSCTVTTHDDEKPPDHFIAFRDLPENPELGHYPGVFAYRFQIFPELKNGHYWALLLWDRIIVTVAFLDPGGE
jgi:hypothetical protein